MIIVLKDANDYVEPMIEAMFQQDISFQNHKKLLMEQTLIYQLMAKISDYIEGEHRIDID